MKFDNNKPAVTCVWAASHLGRVLGGTVDLIFGLFYVLHGFSFLNFLPKIKQITQT